MRKIYSVRLTDAEVDQLKNLIRKKSTTETLARRCHILLDMDENHVSARMSYAQGTNPKASQNHQIIGFSKWQLWSTMTLAYGTPPMSDVVIVVTHIIRH